MQQLPQPDSPHRSDGDPDLATSRALEWPAVVDAWRARCASAAGAARLDGGRVRGGLDGVRRRLEEVAEAWVLLDPAGAPPATASASFAGGGGGAADLAPGDLGMLPDVEEAIDRAERGGELDAAALLGIAETIRLTRTAGGRILLRADRFARLAALFADDRGDVDLQGLTGILAAIEAVVTPGGEIRDDASEELADIRRRMRETRERIRRTLDALLVKFADHLQDRFVTEREGRCVIPVKIEAQSRVPGIVHGTSASGATAFVEPREVVRDGNDLRMLDGAERREVARLLRELSGRVAGGSRSLRLAFGALVALDHRLAAARLAADLRACLPEIAEEGDHRLAGARHPLLVLSGGEVVPNDLDVGPGAALVVSGPNAGGKTVAMKTLGLAVLMAHAGLPVSAASARIRYTERIFCELGDEQSIALSLSSFAAHVSHLARILAEMQPGDLALVDEIAGGTDPAEGAALAVAVVRAFVSRGGAVVVTTHYEPLKRLYERDARVRSACMGLDPDTLRPTYRLHVGQTGSSVAFSTARRYGLPDHVVDEARGLVPRDYLETRERLAEAEALRAAAERDAAAAARGRREVEAERERLEAEIAKARAREHAAVRDEVAGLWRSIHTLREEMRAARQYLRESRKPSAERIRTTEERVERIAERLAPGGTIERTLRGDLPGDEVPPAAHRPGDTVYVVSVGREGVVADVEGSEAIVAFGSVKMRTALGDLRRVKRGVLDPPERAPAGGKARKRGKAGPAAAAQVSWRPKDPDNTIDLRGLRVDEALDTLEKHLDRLFQAEAGTAYVVHGHGTGAVRRAVRERLPDHPLVAEWRPCLPEEGGDGATLVVLR